ncbi:MAG: hypothetical protein JWN86_941 [Planctomycetota bacterium]|nr:hypothetical protein [Planctomycetota bacterium]
MSTEIDVSQPDPDLAPPPGPPPPAAERYRAALGKHHGAQLVAMLQALGSYDRATKPSELVSEVYDRLNEPRVIEALIGRMGPGPRLALGLFAITESPVWPTAGLSHSLAALGLESGPIVAELSGFGVLVPGREGDNGPHVLIAHPAAVAAARTILPEGDVFPAAGPVRQVRESDGLEPILRLAALWQRVDEAAMRRTQQGTLYKRDRERIDDDPVLAGPIADALEPLPDMASLWLMLARGVGLIVDEPNTDRTVAAPAEYWAENGVHLPQMIAQRWLGLRTWHEQGGMQTDDATAMLAPPFLRPAVLLWLARFGPDEWVATADLAEHLDRLHPDWSASLLAEWGDPRTDPAAKGRIGAEARERSASRRKKPDAPPEHPGGVALLEAMLLGPAYQLGLIRAAEEDPSGRRVVRLTELGRYVLAVGPPPSARATFEHFLFVQPNFEVIAYRQGLNSALIGQLSRFMIWTQSGAALEMRLTAESVYRGLEGGLSPEKMLERLARHSSRPLPPGVYEAVKTWSSRRDRVTYFSSAILIEFATAEALGDALAIWSPEPDRPQPIAISDRILLVEDESTIPFGKFKLAGSRDYRRAPEVCVEVERDGVTLSLDLGRSDLFIDTELGRMADELPDEGRNTSGRRRYRVTPSSLSRAVEDGLSVSSLAKWFSQRVGTEVPPALRLLLHASSPKPELPRLSRPIILTSPTTDLLDGLLQHPATRDFLGMRIGPTTVVVPDALLESLRKALADFGLHLDGA